MRNLSTLIQIQRRFHFATASGIRNVLAEKLHSKLTSNEFPQVRVQEIKEICDVTESQAERIHASFSSIELADIVASKLQIENNVVHLPSGVFLHKSFMDWLGATFDNIGSIEWRKKSIIFKQSKIQNVRQLQSFLSRDLAENGEISDIQCYFVARALLPFVKTKTKELEALIDFYEEEKTSGQFENQMRVLETIYKGTQFDCSDWSFAYLAGILDTRGGILLSTRGGRVDPFLFVSISSCNHSILFGLKTMYGGRVHNYPDGLMAWGLHKEEAFRFLKRVSPFLQYKKEHAKLAMENYGKYTKDVHTRMSHLNGMKDISRVFSDN